MSSQTIIEFLEKNAVTCPEGIAAYSRDQDGKWVPMTWEALWKQVLSAASALRGLGFRKNDRALILAPVSLKWDIANYAILLAGGIVVGVETHASDAHIDAVLSEVEVQWVCVDEESRLDGVHSHLVAGLRGAIIFGGSIRKKKSYPLIPWNYLLNEGDIRIGETDRPSPKDPATIIFTSGTTGAPRGILIIHRKMVLAVEALFDSFPEVTNQDRTICWLPLANLFQRIVNMCAVRTGAPVYFLENPGDILSAMKEIQPEVMVSIPRFFEKIHAGIQTKLSQSSLLVRIIVRFTFSLGRKRIDFHKDGKNLKWPSRALFSLLDKLVLQRLRKNIGASRMKFIISGSAPLPPSLLEFFYAAGVLVLEAYGTSENVIPIAINTVKNFLFGSVGKPLPQNQIKLAADNEVLVRGPGVFSGYLTKGVFTNELNSDGFYPTGDLGSFDKNGYLILHGRKADTIKTSNGRKISPTKIENVLKNISYLEHVLVVGHGMSSLIAMVTIDEKRFRDVTGFQGGLHEKSYLVKYMIFQEMGKMMSNLPHIERVKDILLIPESFSVSGGELTPNLKLRRAFIENKYSDKLKSLYQQIQGTENTLPETWKKVG